MVRPPDSSNRDFPPETNKEYPFDQGVAEATARIQQIFEQADRDIFVIVNGSSINVGKTRLTNELEQNLKRAGLEVGHINDDTINAYQNAQHNYQLGRAQTGEPTEKRIYLIQIQGLSLPLSVEKYKQRISAANRRVVGDLYIGIYRPDKPFISSGDSKPIADILIRNEFTKDESTYK